MRGIITTAGPAPPRAFRPRTPASALRTNRCPRCHDKGLITSWRELRCLLCGCRPAWPRPEPRPCRHPACFRLAPAGRLTCTRCLERVRRRLLLRSRAGQCTECPRPRAVNRYGKLSRRCAECLAADRERSQRKQQARREQGLCLLCPTPAPGYSLCARHRELKAASRAERKERRNRRETNPKIGVKDS